MLRFQMLICLSLFLLFPSFSFSDDLSGFFSQPKSETKQKEKKVSNPYLFGNSDLDRRFYYRNLRDENNIKRQKVFFDNKLENRKVDVDFKKLEVDSSSKKFEYLIKLRELEIDYKKKLLDYKLSMHESIEKEREKTLKNIQIEKDFIHACAFTAEATEDYCFSLRTFKMHLDGYNFKKLNPPKEFIKIAK